MTTMTTTSIKRTTEYDVEQIIDSIVLAFSSDPLARWVYPSPQQYLKSFPDFVKIFAGKAFEQQTVYYTDNYSGAALWLPPQSQPNSDAIDIYLQQTISHEQQEKVFAVFEQMSHYNPQEPHWYLALVGVDSTQQRQGYGSALIEPVLKKCDRQQQLAYLESSSPESRSLYERHGFKVMETIQIDDSPPIFPMVRYPKST